MVQVGVSEGILEGETVTNEYGGTYCSFKGIPFAEPPVGDLRFKAPKPLKPWTGVRTAKEYGPVCPQYDHFVRKLIPGSEDCLYLNVYTPELKPKTPLPVMVWIHGGGFIWGSGNDDMYGPEFLVRQGVILVTCNYRLEVLGFLCLDTEEIPGNAGMKDQVAALRWVKNNISNFGGDPENITIFGESAGGASVSYHLISPMSKGLFKRAIVQSGTATSWWAQSFEPRERAIVLAKKLGLDSQDDKELYQFFKNQPALSFIGSQVSITFTEATKLYSNLFFNVVKEKKFGDNERFLHDDAVECFRNGIHEGVEVMAGYVEDESLIIFGVTNILDQMIAQANEIIQYFVPKPIALKCSMKTQLEIARKIKTFYFRNEKISEKNSDTFLKYLSADMISYQIVRMQKMIAKRNKNKLYLYKFSCKSERNIFKHVLAIENIVGDKTMVCHCDDLAYLFPINLYPQKIVKNSKGFQMIDQVTKLWTNFAKYGNPTPDNSLGATWAPYSVQQQDFMDIGEVLLPGRTVDKQEVEFWDGIYDEYLPNFGIHS